MAEAMTQQGRQPELETKTEAEFDPAPIGAFYMQYHKVFDKDGHVLNCTRNETSKLVMISDRIEPGTDHGSVDTGIMQILAIMQLYDRMCARIPEHELHEKERYQEFMDGHISLAEYYKSRYMMDELENMA